MKPYGMTRRQHGDIDVVGSRQHGRATAVYSVNGRSYRGLRGGKKAVRRRWIKRQARNSAKLEILSW